MRKIIADSGLLDSRKYDDVTFLGHLLCKLDPGLTDREKEKLKRRFLKGRWEDTYLDGNWHCSNCGAIIEKDEQGNHNWYYCYHCGARMEGLLDD